MQEVTKVEVRNRNAYQRVGPHFGPGDAFLLPHPQFTRGEPPVSGLHAIVVAGGVREPTELIEHLLPIQRRGIDVTTERAEEVRGCRLEQNPLS